MNQESVITELIKNEIDIVESPSPYHFNEENLVINTGQYNFLIYVYEDGLEYYLLNKQGRNVVTSHYGSASSVEEMLEDLGLI